MKNNTNGDLIVSGVFMVVASVLSVTKFMNGETTDAILWIIVVLVTLIKYIRRDIYNHKK